MQHHHFTTSPNSHWALALALLFSVSHVLAADTAGSQVAAWAALAKATDAGFAPSADRGRAFYVRQGGQSADMNSCAACHTANPAQAGKHVVTSKTIAPMSPQVNPDRFTDATKTEKWFKRNCNDVLARACTPAEKADLVSYLMGAK
jgi:mono/diheme cytochrome c family protein